MSKRKVYTIDELKLLSEWPKELMKEYRSGVRFLTNNPQYKTFPVYTWVNSEIDHTGILIVQSFDINGDPIPFDSDPS